MPKIVGHKRKGPVKIAAKISDCESLEEVWDRILKNSSLAKLDPDVQSLLKSTFMLGFKACVRSKDFNKYVKWSKDLINYIDEKCQPK